MYIGLKNIQNLFSTYSTLLTNSDGIHCLTGWTKLNDALPPYTDHLLYTCKYSDDLMDLPLNENMHILCIVDNGTNLYTIADKFPVQPSLLILESSQTSPIYIELQQFFNTQCGVGLFGQTLLEFLAFEDGLSAGHRIFLPGIQEPCFCI